MFVVFVHYNVQKRSEFSLLHECILLINLNYDIYNIIPRIDSIKQLKMH